MKYVLLCLLSISLAACSMVDRYVSVSKPNLNLEQSTPLTLSQQSIIFVHDPEKKVYTITEAEAKKLIETLDDIQFWIESERQITSAYTEFYSNP